MKELYLTFRPEVNGPPFLQFSIEFELFDNPNVQHSFHRVYIQAAALAKCLRLSVGSERSHASVMEDFLFIKKRLRCFINKSWEGLMNWTNMQISNGFNFNFFDSNSHYFSRLREDSLQQAPLFQHDAQQMHNASLFDAENTVNFEDLASKPKKENFYNNIQELSQSNEQLPESPHHFHLSRITKGLKDLAKLLMETIRSSQPFSQAEIVKLIEGQLCHLNNERTDDKIKTQKNIKRRIYDALNVMISAGLLQRQLSQIRIRPKQTLEKFSEKAQNQIGAVRERIQKKRELLTKLKSQKKALNYWILHNQLTKKRKGEKQLAFPLIFVVKEREDIWMNIDEEMVVMRNEGLQFLSETDIIQRLYLHEQFRRPSVSTLTQQPKDQSEQSY